MLPVEITTGPYTKTLNIVELKTSFKKASLSILDACKRREAFLDTAGRPVDICDGILFLNEIAIHDRWPELIRKTFVQCFVATEARAKSSGIFACFILAKLLLFECHDSSVDAVKEARKSTLTTKKNALCTIEYLLGKNSASLFFNIIDYVGTSGQINIRTGSKTFPVLEIFSGHNFDLGIDPGFCIGHAEREVAYVFLVDGAIESVAEIDRILQHCHKNSISTILVARKFGDDVLSTLNANFQRKTLDVIPILAQDQISTLNVFSDLSAVTGGNVVNAQSGQAIIGIDPSELTTISKLRCSRKLFAFNSLCGNQELVQRRIQELRDRIQKEMFQDSLGNKDIRVFLQERINSLSVASATLWLPAESNQNGLYEFVDSRFKFSIGILDGFCQFGAVELSDVELEHNFDEFGISFLPGNILFHSLAMAQNIAKNILEVGGCIVVDKGV